MSRRERLPQPEEPIEPADSAQSPEGTAAELVTPPPDQSVPRHLSEEEKHRREEIIHDFQIRFRLEKLGLTIAEHRAKRAMPRGSGPRNTGKQGQSKSANESAKNLRKEE